MPFQLTRYQPITLNTPVEPFKQEKAAEPKKPYKPKVQSPEDISWRWDQILGAILGIISTVEAKDPIKATPLDNSSSAFWTISALALGLLAGGVFFRLRSKSNARIATPPPVLARPAASFPYDNQQNERTPSPNRQAATTRSEQPSSNPPIPRSLSPISISEPSSLVITSPPIASPSPSRLKSQRKMNEEEQIKYPLTFARDERLMAQLACVGIRELWDCLTIPWDDKSLRTLNSWWHAIRDPDKSYIISHNTVSPFGYKESVFKTGKLFFFNGKDFPGKGYLIHEIVDKFKQASLKASKVTNSQFANSVEDLNNNIFDAVLPWYQDTCHVPCVISALVHRAREKYPASEDFIDLFLHEFLARLEIAESKEEVQPSQTQASASQALVLAPSSDKR